MPTKDTTTISRRDRLHGLQVQQASRQRRLQVWMRLVTGVVTLAIIGIVTYGLWSAQPEQGEASGKAPGFSLATTAGTTVSLSDYRGKPVLLYFNEGAGCGSCTQQMAAIEKEPGFKQAGIVVLPIVMNTREQIQPDLDTFSVTTPYLLDDGTVSKAYDTLDKGMHPGLPGHGFVLIDEDGNKLWHGNYPSMWLEPGSLLQEATSRL